MVDKIRPRKAAGSDDRFGSSNLEGRAHRQSERPHAPSHDTTSRDTEEEHDGFEGDRRSRSSATRNTRLVELPQESSVDHQQLQDAQVEESRPSGDEDLRDDSSVSSEDWEEVPRTVSDNQTGALTTRNPSPTPCYDFPGTWPAAATDTAAALSQVSTATRSYASAIASSGLGKASWSIGTAALSSTNKAALSFAGWGMAKTGVLPGDLPRPLRSWVKSKEEKGVRRRERRSREGLTRGETVDVEGGFVLDLYGTTREGEFVGSVPRSQIPLEVEEEQGTREEEEEAKDDGLVRLFEFDD